MFLVRDRIPTEPIWTAFIAAAAELKLLMHVPPPAPHPTRLLHAISEHTADLNATCWPLDVEHGTWRRRLQEGANQQQTGKCSVSLSFSWTQAKHRI